MSVIPGRIRRWREAAGLTRIELARKLLVSPQSVWSWERGRTSPRLPMLERIAKVCGTDIGGLTTAAP